MLVRSAQQCAGQSCACHQHSFVHLNMVQGRDEVGRPLLQRALALQEKLLGPTHPDVVAIRDVLASEDD